MNDRFGLETSETMSGVSLAPEARRRLLVYVDLLRKWQKAQNLVSRDTLADVWSRHIADSLQLIPIIVCARLAGFNGVDLGSGAGLPGLILALATAPDEGGAVDEDGPTGGNPETHAPFAMTLVESNARKVSFLRTVSRETQTRIDIRGNRAEAANHPTHIEAEFITARALAPLGALMTLAEPWISRGATAFFHKGGEYARELAEWPDANAHHVIEHVSVVDPNSRILQIARKDVDLPRPAP